MESNAVQVHKGACHLTHLTTEECGSYELVFDKFDQNETTWSKMLISACSKKQRLALILAAA